MSGSADISLVQRFGFAVLCLASGCAPSSLVAQLPGASAALDAWRLEEGIEGVRSATVDLNGDGVDEFAVLASDLQYCGSGGCTFFVLAADKGALRTVSRSTITRAPIRALSTSTQGWRDLVVRVGGGGEHTRDVVLRWTGRGYSPNPSLAPTYEGGSANETVIALD